MTWEIRHGIALDELRGLATASVDAVVTDPPYALTGVSRKGSPRINPDTPYGRHRIGERGFMNKTWDAELPSVDVWAECLRVLKPGAHLVAFGGTRTWHRQTCLIEDAGFEIRDCLSWLYGQGFPKSKDLGDGWGTALKPSWEPIVLCRAPLSHASIEKNMAAHGTGGLNIEAAKVDGDRWPPNVAMTEDVAQDLDGKTGELVSGANPTRRGSDKFRNTYGEFVGERECVPVRGVDRGGASRFMYVPKVKGAEREGNDHPTIKPVALMRWLVRLVARRGALVVDPYCGSGSTGVAALAEGCSFIGIEREADYAAIARDRIGGPLFAEAGA